MSPKCPTTQNVVAKIKDVFRCARHMSWECRAIHGRREARRCVRTFYIAKPTWNERTHLRFCAVTKTTLIIHQPNANEKGYSSIEFKLQSLWTNKYFPKTGWLVKLSSDRVIDCYVVSAWKYSTVTYLRYIGQYMIYFGLLHGLWPANLSALALKIILWNSGRVDYLILATYHLC